MSSPFALTSVMNVYIVLRYVVKRLRSRGQERQRGAADSGAGRGSAAPRLRDREADRIALQRRDHVSGSVALSDAVPPGETGAHRRPMGGESGRAPPALLPADAGGAQGPE